MIAPAVTAKRGWLNLVVQRRSLRGARRQSAPNRSFSISNQDNMGIDARLINSVRFVWNHYIKETECNQQL